MFRDRIELPTFRASGRYLLSERDTNYTNETLVNNEAKKPLFICDRRICFFSEILLKVKSNSHNPKQPHNTTHKHQK
jgi:hypothetical protein